MLKILHVLDHSLPLHSGYTFRSQNIFLAQIKRGWQPVILTSPKHEASWRGPWISEEAIGGIRYYRTGASRRIPMPFGSEIVSMWSLARRLRTVARLEKPSVIHAHSPILNALPALWVGKRLGIPVVYEIRAFWEDAAVDLGSYNAGSLRYRLVKLIETWICRRVNHVTVICQGLRNDLIQRGIPKGRLTVIPNGVDPEDFKEVHRDEEFDRAWNLTGKKVVGFVGSFYRYEGLDLLINAFARMAKARQDIALLLVGGGPMEEELKELVLQLGLGQTVLMPGRISHDRISGVYALIDVLAYPRYSNRLTELVTPLKPLEAMVVGKPLAASDIGGHSELIRHGVTGLLFRAGDEAALADALIGMLDNEATRQAIAVQAMAWVRHERLWDKTTEKYVDVYANVLGREVGCSGNLSARPV